MSEPIQPTPRQVEAMYAVVSLSMSLVNELGDTKLTPRQVELVRQLESQFLLLRRSPLQ